jgi:hypothetical protein
VADALIFVVDSQDRERIGKSAAEFQTIIQVIKGSLGEGSRGKDSKQNNDKYQR